MMRKLILLLMSCMVTLSFLAGCEKEEARQGAAGELTDAQVEDIVRRSYQYVALYNVVNKGAMDPKNPAMTGWNNCVADTALKDHNLKIIARPNNDTLYITCALDLRKDAVILDVPAFNSKYVSLMTFTYDHYVNVPLATRKGDFRKPERVIFYSIRTEGYKGKPVKGVDRVFEMTGDFVGAVFRVMPHSNEPEKFKKIVGQMKSVKLLTLSEFKGGKAKSIDDVKFPAFGKTDADVFGNNLLEVMQFVFNHLTFDPEDKIDQGVLAAYKPLGVEPGKVYDPSRMARIDGKKFREIAQKVQKDNFAILTAGKFSDYAVRIFRPKGETDLDALVLVSVVGPIGLPLEEATYPAVTTKDSKPMNAMNDYVIKMTKDQLPPARAFWSLTLYDLRNGFFIPNDRKKYSVGENAGMKLNADGGIEIHVAADQPEGVPEENWLPINRKDENLDIILRIYIPDLERLKSWSPPKAEIASIKQKDPQVRLQDIADDAQAAPSSHYMGTPAELVIAPNGAIVNKEVLEELPRVAWTEGPEIENPVEGVYVLGGYLISACIVIDADDGLIVFDTGDTREDGKKLLEAIRTFSDKPVVGPAHTPCGCRISAYS